MTETSHCFHFTCYIEFAFASSLIAAHTHAHSHTTSSIYVVPALSAGPQPQFMSAGHTASRDKCIHSLEGPGPGLQWHGGPA